MSIVYNARLNNNIIIYIPVLNKIVILTENTVTATSSKFSIKELFNIELKDELVALTDFCL